MATSANQQGVVGADSGAMWIWTEECVILGGYSPLIIYHILSQQKSYEDLGSNYFDERDRQHTEKRLVRQLEKLGYQVQLQPVA